MSALSNITNAPPTSKNILIVEDNDSHFKILVRHFNGVKASFSLMRASSLVEAHQVVRDKSIDCVLLDLVLPDSPNPRESFIGMLQCETNIPIIVLTSLHDNFLATELVKDGAQDFLSKDNLSPARLEHVITFSIERHRLINEIERTNQELKTAYLELNHVKEELERSNRDLKDFAYVASHDLQEPLRIMTSMSNILQRRYEIGSSIDGKAMEYLNFIESSAKRQRNMIKSLLDYAQLFSKDRLLSSVDLNKVLFNILNDLSMSIQENNVHLTYPENMPLVYADEEQIYRLFFNLIVNSIKYRHPQRDCKIEIRFQEGDGIIEFEVEDNGIGFDMEYKEQVFKVFQRLHSQDEIPGTGMGLSECRKILENLKGRIWVKSCANEIGTCMAIEIPACQTEEKIDG